LFNQRMYSILAVYDSHPLVARYMQKVIELVPLLLYTNDLHTLSFKQWQVGGVWEQWQSALNTAWLITSWEIV